MPYLTGSGGSGGQPDLFELLMSLMQNGGLQQGPFGGGAPPAPPNFMGRPTVEPAGGNSNVAADFANHLGGILGGGSSQPSQNSDLAQLLLGPIGMAGNTYGGLATAGTPLVAGSEGYDVNDPMAVQPGTVFEPKQPKGPNYQDQLLQQLMALATSGSGAYDPSQQIADASQGIRQAFGAQIAALQHQNQGARADTAEGKKQIQAMYRALAKDMRKMGKREQRQSNKLSNRLQNMGQAGAAAAQQNAAGILNQNAAVANSLGGGGDLMAALSNPVNKQTTAIGGRAINEATRQATNQTGLGGVARRFFNTAAGTSRMEGTERSADLIANLQDYLQGNRDEMAGIRGQQAMALADAKNQILSTAAEGQSDQQQQMLENLMAIAKLKMQMDKAQMDKRQSIWEMRNPEGQFGEQNNPFAEYLPDDFFAASMLARALPPEAQEAFTSVANSPEFLRGYMETGTGDIPLGGNMAAINQLIGQQLMAQGIDLPPEVKQMLAFALIQQAAGLPSTMPGI